MHKESFVDPPVSCSNIDAAFPAIGEEERLEFLRRDRKVLRTRLPRNRIALLGSFLIALLFFRAASRNQLAGDKSLYRTQLSIDMAGNDFRIIFGFLDLFLGLRLKHDRATSQSKNVVESKEVQLAYAK